MHRVIEEINKPFNFFIDCINSSFSSPTISHTLPAGGVHPRPPLETNAGRKSLKRFSSAGPDAMHIPPPDYPGDLENKPEANHLPSADTLDQSGS